MFYCSKERNHCLYSLSTVQPMRCHTNLRYSGDFSSRARIFFVFFWGGGSTIRSPPCACLLPLIGAQLMPTYFTLYGRISPQWLADWDDCGRVLPVEMRVNSFPTLCLCSIVSPIRLPEVKDVRVFRCNFAPVLLTEWAGSCKVPLRYHGAGTDTK